MPETLPFPSKTAGMRVPKGGSMCKNCRFLGKDEKTCTNQGFIEWDGPSKPAGSDKLPAPYDEYCSNWYMPAPGALAHRWRSGQS